MSAAATTGWRADGGGVTLAGSPDGPAPLTAEAFRRATGVSRETLDRLQAYADLLVRWQARVNLVGRSSLADLWRRHMLDSAQLAAMVPPGTRCLVDLGSGAGFPGLVLAILGVDGVHLIESDRKKCAFLREAARQTAAPVQILAERIEDVPPFPADVITARALAPLRRLIPLARPFVRPDTVLLFLKGQDVDRELTEATKQGILTVARTPSMTSPDGTVLRIGGDQIV